ncbi:DUF7144 family membrane protein [Cumulibacter soli]|uniref:DUF7144 family membrane protein n=1 Tax=Cumulibacter soli TaxID=2546344 RepID=UPI0010686BB3|nr:hypothetical protein [Cumulibacter soli]
MSTPTQTTKRPMSSSGVFGGTAFAVAVLTLVGLFQILLGIAAVAADKVFVSGVDYVYMFDLTVWGWIHLIVGIVSVAVALGLAMEQTWARIAGIVIASIAAVTHFAFVPYQPIWSLIVIAFCVLVIWALSRQVDDDVSL